MAYIIYSGVSVGWEVLRMLSSVSNLRSTAVKMYIVYFISYKTYYK